MLLEDVVKGREGQEELLSSHLGRFVLNVEVVEGFSRDSLTHVSLESESFICDGVKTSSCRDLAFIL